MITRATLSTIEQGLPKYRSMLAGNAAYVPPSFESIATTTVGAGGTKTITFSSIPSTYKHLQVRFMTKDTYSLVADWVSFGMSANGTNTWRVHYFYGDGSSISVNTTTTAAIFFTTPNSASSLNDIFGVGIIDIIDYANTNKNKTFNVLTGLDNNTNTIFSKINQQSLLKIDTTAIDTLTFTGDANFAEKTTFALYGIKG